MDITHLIQDDHAEIRRLFAIIEAIGPGDAEALGAVWVRLEALLDAHAEAEERFFYPELLKVGQGAADADDAKDETCDAIKDHNEIRDAAKAVGEQRVGSEAWFQAVAEVNKANGDHLAEEERQGLADFRRNADLKTSHRLAVAFAAFQARHLTGVSPVNKDPSDYVEANR